MKASLWLIVVFLVLSISVIFIHGQKFSQRRRRSKEIEDRINKLDDATKARINAMKASGMPHEAIAEKVAYETGGKNMAKRIVDAMSSDNSDYTKKQKTDKVKEDMKKKIDKAVKSEKTKAAEKAAKSTAKGKAKATPPPPAAKVTPLAAKVTPPAAAKATPAATKVIPKVTPAAAKVKTAKKASTSSSSNKNMKTSRK